MIEINNLCAKIKDTGKEILKGVSLNIKPGEVHAIMGPNGTGKSTLSKVILGNYMYEVTDGDILFSGDSIIKLPVYERARKGIFLCMQDPTVIDGVSNSEFLRTALGEVNGEKVNLYTFIKSMEDTMKKVELDSSMLHRSLNKGFSGGEKKKNEILQMILLKPKFIILDELDSGLDVDSLRIVCENINDYLKENPDVSVLIITHYTRVLKYIKPSYVHVMRDGKIVKTGTMDLAYDIEKNGYNGINVMIGNEENE
ncbi:MAG: Fe-S cluster assembly ATPase SufC [Bacilli bacterium]|nr:Fe-S cluster assembly ATPase SufC [Mycoplasmatota bacterium]MDD6941481.1 Fe-S cluster assembly ATPase SufC [bacterium]MDY2696787.1 Fe-S cluster assembly ATPase SufC [Bacilli bacterium]MEE0014523.1 Fe-S cluster assembly ATPase SufC [Bacilli bacterium]